jgi:hypothetical protein
MEGWDYPSCITEDNDGKPSVQRNGPDEQADLYCFNQLAVSITSDFTIEWEVRVTGAAALFVLRPEGSNVYYFVQVFDEDGATGLSEWRGGERSGVELERLVDYPADKRFPGRDNVHVVRIARLGSMMQLAVNGGVVHEWPDSIFGNPPISLQVGFGATGTRLSDNEVHLITLRVTGGQLAR